MNEKPLAHMICASCTRHEKAEIGANEALFQAKGRARAALGANCPRGEATAHLCPMRVRAQANPSL